MIKEELQASVKYINKLVYALIQSYDPVLFDEKKIENICVGLTVAKTRACIRKVKELRG